MVARAAPKAEEPAQRPARADRLARMLALAHYIERLIEAGEVASYGEVARALGLTQPRVTQVMGLLFLSPAIQERVLLGEMSTTSGSLMRVAREAEWESQENRTPNACVVSEIRGVVMEMPSPKFASTRDPASRSR